MSRDTGRGPNRREFVGGLGGAAIAAALPGAGFGQAGARPLEMPPLLDATETGRFSLRAQAGKTNFLGGAATLTAGYNQAYLGPVLRLKQGAETEASVENALNEPVSSHWHGLLIPGEADGGPHQAIAPGEVWKVVLPIEQPVATTWFHTHIHERTAPQVYAGLAGVLQISDGRDDERGLPATYGEDDLMLVVQDRRFDWRGRMKYAPGMQDNMAGFMGDTVLVNGQVGRSAVVPAGIVRLRLLNGSNARIYRFALASGRDMHLIATDTGLLPAPQALGGLVLAPGERAEILVDFTGARAESLISATIANSPMGGMMGGMMGGGGGGGGSFEVLKFAVDSRLPARITALPGDIGGSLPDLDANGAVERRITLDMRMGGGMMLGMLGGGNVFSINGEAFDMGHISLSARRGAVELWRVSGELMMHPFHVHGTRFQVLAENGRAPALQNRGWKDTVLVNGQVDLLMQFDHDAPESAPFMYHCHILEHEDLGMMAQFTVS